MLESFCGTVLRVLHPGDASVGDTLVWSTFFLGPLLIPILLVIAGFGSAKLYKLTVEWPSASD